MITKSLKILLVTALACTSTQTFADQADRRGWFIGGALGSISTSAKSRDIIDRDEEAIDKQFFVGYHFTHWFGLEAAVSSSEEFDVGDNIGDGSLRTASFMTKFRLGLGKRAELYVKAGPTLIFAELDGNRESDEFEDASWSESTIGLGTGFVFEASPHINLRLALDYAKETLDEDHGWWRDDAPSNYLDVEYTRTTLGLYYQF